jgi:hypothetical protein
MYQGFPDFLFLGHVTFTGAFLSHFGTVVSMLYVFGGSLVPDNRFSHLNIVSPPLIEC